MMTSRDTSSENDVLYEFALTYRHPNPGQLDAFVRRHPEHAAALTTLASELARDAAVDEEASESEELDAETEAMLSRAMSRFQNRLYAVRAALAPEAAPRLTLTPESARNPFSSHTPREMHALVIRLDVSPPFLMRLRDRGIRPDTMTPGFLRYIAAGMEEPEEELSMHFAAKHEIHRQTHFKASVIPTAGAQITFEEAVCSSGLTPEQQARLLAL
jgi:hypothetical protein